MTKLEILALVSGMENMLRSRGVTEGVQIEGGIPQFPDRPVLEKLQHAKYLLEEIKTMAGRRRKVLKMGIYLGFAQGILVDAGLIPLSVIQKRNPCPVSCSRSK